MASLLPGYQFIAWLGADLTLSTASWKNNVTAVYSINTLRTGFISFTPASGFPAVTKVAQGGIYLFKVLNAFSLPDAVLTVVSGGTPPTTVNTFDLSQSGATGIGLNLLEVQKTGYVQRSPFATFTVQTDHTSADVTVNTRGVADTSPYVYVFIGSTLVGVAATKATSDDPTRATNKVKATVSNLPTGNKTLSFRTGAAQYTDLTIGYVDSSMTEVALSGGTTSTATAVAKKPNFFAVLGDSIWSSADPAGADGNIGLVPKLRNRLAANWDVYAHSASGAQLVPWYGTNALQVDIAQRIVAAAVSHIGLKVVYVELGTNDFGAGNTPLAYRRILTRITDKIRALDPTIRIVWQTATYRNIQATPIGGFVLEDYRQAARDAAQGRGDYVTLLEGAGIVSNNNFYTEAQVLHPNPAGQDQIVEAINTLLGTITAGQNTAVYTPAPVADSFIADYEGNDFTDSTSHHLDLVQTGNGAVVTSSSGLLNFTNGKYLYRAGDPLDYLFGGFKVEFAFQYAGNTDIFHWLAREYGVFDVTLVMTSGATIGNIAFSCTDLYGNVVTLSSANFNVTAGLVAGSVQWNADTATMSITINGATVSQPLASLNSKLAGWRIGEAFAGTIDYVKISQLGTGGTPPPSQAPTVTNASPMSGVVGAQYRLLGTNLIGATVTFTAASGTVPATNVLENSTSGQIVVSVPAGFVGGNVTVSNQYGSVVAGVFTVADTAAPSVTSYTPYAAITGDRVSIYGVNLLGSTVTFNGVAAIPVQNSFDTQTLVNVPDGNIDGDIVLTNAAGKTISVGTFQRGIPVQNPQLIDDPEFLNAIGTNWTETNSSGNWIIANGQATRVDNGNFSRLHNQTNPSFDVTGKLLRAKIVVASIDSGKTIDVGSTIASGYSIGQITSAGTYYFTFTGSYAQQILELTLSSGSCVIESASMYLMD